MLQKHPSPTPRLRSFGAPVQTQVIQADEGLVLVTTAFSETQSAVVLNDAASNTRSTLKPVTGVVDISIYTMEGETQKVASDKPIFVTWGEVFVPGFTRNLRGRVGVLG